MTAWQGGMCSLEFARWGSVPYLQTCLNIRPQGADLALQ